MVWAMFHEKAYKFSTITSEIPIQNSWRSTDEILFGHKLTIGQRTNMFFLNSKNRLCVAYCIEWRIIKNQEETMCLECRKHRVTVQEQCRLSHNIMNDYNKLYTMHENGAWFLLKVSAFILLHASTLKWLKVFSFQLTQVDILRDAEHQSEKKNRMVRGRNRAEGETMRCVWRPAHDWVSRDHCFKGDR